MESADQNVPGSSSGGRAVWRTYITAMLAIVPTVNGILLALQAALAAEPLRSGLPPWIYIAANLAVALGALGTRMVHIILENGVIRHWLGLTNKPADTTEGRDE